MKGKSKQAEPVHVDKAVARQVAELFQGLLVVRDSLRAVKSGKEYMFMPLAAQMRALVTDRSKNNEPRLLALAKLFHHPLVLYAMHGVDNDDMPEELRKARAYHVVSGVSAEPLVGFKHREIELGKLRQEKLLHIDGVDYTAEKIVNWFANELGGAHYAKKERTAFEALNAQAYVGGYPILHDLFARLAIATFGVAVGFVRRLLEFSLDLILAMPKQDIGTEHYILDAFLPGSAIRWSLLLHPDWSIEFRCSDYDGRQMSARSSASGYPQAHVAHVRLSVEVSGDLEMLATLSVDGVEVATASAERPHLVPNAVEQYDLYLNRRWDGDGQVSKLAVCEMMMIGRAWTSSDKEPSLEYFTRQRQDPGLKGIVYADGAFGVRAHGERDMKISGSAKQLLVKDWLAGLE